MSPFFSLTRFKPSQPWSSFFIGLFSGLMSAIPVMAANSIFFVYTPISLSVRVESLAEFAKTGDVDPDLRFYFNITGTSAQEQEAFRRALLEQAQVDPVLLSRLFNTDIGEAILETFGEIIQIQRDGNGKYALRGALITAAFEPEGLTLLNFLQELPVNIQIDISQALALSSAVSAVVDATTMITADIARLSLQEVQPNPPDFSQLPDLRLQGSYGVQEREVWNLYDQSRNRKLYALVYKPQRYPPGKIPVIIFSHGLASRPEDFAEQARHLASYGYVVVLPNHPGSDINQVRGLIEGFNRDIFVLNEFIDRPLDISFMIDVLESRNQEQFEGRLNLKSVGVAGHSFGGYGALAVAGATLNFDYLEKECSQQFRYLNVSLLLQCRALQLPRKEYNFRDERVGAVFVANPVNSAIFGPEGLAKINIPVFLGAGTYDPATPVIFEQARSFPWFTVPNKYLLVIEGQAHVDFSQLDAGLTEVIGSVENLTLPSPYLINSYANAMMTAFFQTYTANNPDYLVYLQPSYAVYLSQGEPFKSFLITSESSDELAQILAQLRDRNPLFR